MLPSRDEIVKLLRELGYNPDIVREYTVTIRTRRHRKGGKVYEEAQAIVTIPVQRELAGKKLRVLVIAVVLN